MPRDPDVAAAVQFCTLRTPEAAALSCLIPESETAAVSFTVTDDRPLTSETNVAVGTAQTSKRV